MDHVNLKFDCRAPDRKLFKFHLVKFLSFEVQFLRVRAIQKAL